MGRPSIHVIYSELYQNEAKSYRNYLEILGYCSDTCQSKYLMLREFFSQMEELGIYKLPQITAVEIVNYWEYIRNRKNLQNGKLLSLKSVYEHIRCLQSFFGYALHLGKIKTNPASHLKVNHVWDKPERTIFTRVQIHQLYAKAQTLQERSILHMGYGCGLRVDEISQLNREDIRLSENMVIVQKGKNSKRRLVPITEKVKEELQTFLEEETRSPAVFYNIKNTRMQQWTFNKLLKQIIGRTSFGKDLNHEELNKLGMHSLRHSIATHLLENGMKLEQVQTFLGHSFIESTETYTHINQQQINGLMK